MPTQHKIPTDLDVIFFWLNFCNPPIKLLIPEKEPTMKKLILLLLISGAMYSQEQVFNVQQYCIDEKPFKKGECDITGNEYSFVFVDAKKNDVVFFLTNMKLKYEIVSTVVSDTKSTVYVLKNESGEIEMHVNKQKTRIDFFYPDKEIHLKVGKSTKLQ
jgi:hypothetical protein